MVGSSGMERQFLQSASSKYFYLLDHQVQGGCPPSRCIHRTHYHSLIADVNWQSGMFSSVLWYDPVVVLRQLLRGLKLKRSCPPRRAALSSFRALPVCHPRPFRQALCAPTA